jgi:hypothetical protein
MPSQGGGELLGLILIILLVLFLLGHISICLNPVRGWLDAGRRVKAGRNTSLICHSVCPDSK